MKYSIMHATIRLHERSLGRLSEKDKKADDKIRKKIEILVNRIEDMNSKYPGIKEVKIPEDFASTSPSSESESESESENIAVATAVPFVKATATAIPVAKVLGKRPREPPKAASNPFKTPRDKEERESRKRYWENRRKKFKKERDNITATKKIQNFIRNKLKQKKRTQKQRQSVKIPTLDLTKLPRRKSWRPPEGISSARIFSKNEPYYASESEGDSDGEKKQPTSRRKTHSNRGPIYTRSKSAKSPHGRNSAKSPHGTTRRIQVKPTTTIDFTQNSGRKKKKRRKKKKGGRKTRKRSK